MLMYISNNLKRNIQVKQSTNLDLFFLMKEHQISKRSCENLHQNDLIQVLSYTIMGEMRKIHLNTQRKIMNKVILSIFFLKSENKIEESDRIPEIQIIFSLEGSVQSRFFNHDMISGLILDETSSAEVVAHALFPDVEAGSYPVGLGLYNSVEGM